MKDFSSVTCRPYNNIENTLTKTVWRPTAFSRSNVYGATWGNSTTETMVTPKLNPFKYNITQQKYISYDHTNFNFKQSIHSLVSEIWKFKTISLSIKLSVQEISYTLYSHCSTKLTNDMHHCLGTESSKLTVCSGGVQQVYGFRGCTWWGNPRRSLERYQDSPAGSGHRNDWIRQVAEEKENNVYLMTLTQ